eukprot:TRINITY_DN1958_c0_g1_i4.p1 TRINITY_DN1958_c0_g1~~TRINITY_DN1958_c0_g1_i4.p1  ORF type:complete len:895 (+),score=219.41 TRINITY_DN1958_c0_g1_i4:48-2732(+)
MVPLAAAATAFWLVSGAAHAASSGSGGSGGSGGLHASHELAPLLSWEDAYDLAGRTLSQMAEDEKYSLMTGLGWYQTYQLTKWWYVGNTPAIRRLGIPSLNMQDAAAGFRPYWREMVGTSTCWPCGLALGATWDPEVVQEFAAALGEEFKAKGANAILGPSVEVHRVARNGRNFEYLSGEDPYLGGRLTAAYIQGVQSQGLFAVVKHFILNHQELRRRTQSSNVDYKVLHELYYGPFYAAVEAGVAALMCSYNQVNGEPACGNRRLLKGLKEELGFKGFVQSDWWAAHRGVAAGLDQEMPGSGASTFRPHVLKRERPGDIDDAVTRILAVMHRHNLSAHTKCSPPHCEEWMRKDVTSAAHHALARRLAAESAVLLKNSGGVLPLGKSEDVKSLAVIGKVAVAEAYNPDGKNQGENAWARGDYYSGGGSGHVAAGFAIKPLDAIRERAQAANMVVKASASNNKRRARELASEVDVAIVVVGTTAGESYDRGSLYVDDGGDQLIEEVAKVATRTIVLLQIPGAVLMPWRDSVDAIFAMFLGGQATGDAWADVLFADILPSGRMPIMIPASDEDHIPPSDTASVQYSEGLETSYRSTSLKAAFPFGHGLAYTTFSYLEPATVEGTGCGEDSVMCLSIDVRNVGAAAGRTVAQLYLEFPAEAGHPAPFLKGFQKTAILRPGDVATVVFKLRRQELSYYKAPPPASCYRWKYKTYYASCSASPSEKSALESLESLGALSSSAAFRSDASGGAHVASRDCCSRCQGSDFCSPRSWNCYDRKAKWYYQSCRHLACCTRCAGSYCSPVSGRCYSSKAKHYYHSCATTTSPTPVNTTTVTTTTTTTTTMQKGEWIMAQKFVAHIGESSADIRLRVPFDLTEALQPLEETIDEAAGDVSALFFP